VDDNAESRAFQTKKFGRQSDHVFYWTQDFAACDIGRFLRLGAQNETGYSDESSALLYI
jgi:hypothetical protein